MSEGSQLSRLIHPFLPVVPYQFSHVTFPYSQTSSSLIGLKIRVGHFIYICLAYFSCCNYYPRFSPCPLGTPGTMNHQRLGLPEARVTA